MMDIDRRGILGRLFENAPAGATWMLHSMNCPPCGMGHIPPASRFFLKFMTQ